MKHSIDQFSDNQPSYPDGFNPNDYKQDLGVDELSSQEIEMLQTLWNIMSQMVDIGWGVDSVQMLLPELFDLDRSDSVNSVKDNLEKGSSDE